MRGQSFKTGQSFTKFYNILQSFSTELALQENVHSGSPAHSMTFESVGESDLGKCNDGTRIQLILLAVQGCFRLRGHREQAPCTNTGLYPKQHN